MKKVICLYCSQPAKRATGKTVYPHRPDLYQKKFYVCNDCDARVGCHKNGWKPLGRLANAELRKLKMETHAAFDPIWESGWMNRNEAYRWLAERLGIKVKRCHIGQFNEEQCRQAISHSMDIMREKEALDKMAILLSGLYILDDDNGDRETTS